MPFEFDPTSGPGFTEVDKIDRQESAGDRLLTVVNIRIDQDLCEASGVCSEVCPEEVLGHSSGHPTVLNAAACTECWICVENCVSGAIEIG